MAFRKRGKASRRLKRRSRSSMSKKFSLAVLGNLFNRLKIQEKINFARHLSIMIEAGLPIFEALKITRRQSTSKKLGRILDQVIIDVSNGQSLAGSLRD